MPNAWHGRHLPRRTNVNGVLQWEKHFGGGGTVFGVGTSVQQTKDAGYLVAGCIQTNQSNHTNVYLLKTNIKGDEIWKKTLSAYGCYSAQQTVDDGYIVAGQIPHSFPNVDTYLAKLSPESPAPTPPPKPNTNTYTFSYPLRLSYPYLLTTLSLYPDTTSNYVEVTYTGSTYASIAPIASLYTTTSTPT